MRSSVATEDCSRILTASIGGGAVSRLLSRQIISKFQSDNLTAELERAYRASAFSHRETGSWLWVSRFSVWYAYRYSPNSHTHWDTGITQAIFFALGPLWINVVHIAYEDFDGCGEMQSSVATESCDHREGISSHIYGIDRRGRCQQTII